MLSEDRNTKSLHKLQQHLNVTHAQKTFVHAVGLHAFASCSQGLLTSCFCLHMLHKKVCLEDHPCFVFLLYIQSITFACHSAAFASQQDLASSLCTSPCVDQKLSTQRHPFNDSSPWISQTNADYPSPLVYPNAI